MKLSPELIKRFVDATVPKQAESKASTVYGTAVVQGTDVFVHLDGAEEGVLTPVSYMATVDDGDRVMVTIKDRRATITGNMTTAAGEPPGYQALVRNVNEHISNDEIHLSEDDIAAIEAVEARINTINEALVDSVSNPNLITSGIVKELRSYIVGIVYPVGSVYAAFGVGVPSPATTIGGSWESIIDHDDGVTPTWHFWKKTSGDDSGGGSGGDDDYSYFDLITIDDINRICV